MRGERAERPNERLTQEIRRHHEHVEEKFLVTYEKRRKQDHTYRHRHDEVNQPVPITVCPREFENHKRHGCNADGHRKDDELGGEGRARKGHLNGHLLEQSDGKTHENGSLSHNRTEPGLAGCHGAERDVDRVALVRRDICKQGELAKGQDCSHKTTQEAGQRLQHEHVERKSRRNGGGSGKHAMALILTRQRHAPVEHKDGGTHARDQAGKHLDCHRKPLGANVGHKREQRGQARSESRGTHVDARSGILEKSLVNDTSHQRGKEEPDTRDEIEQRETGPVHTCEINARAEHGRRVHRRANPCAVQGKTACECHVRLASTPWHGATRRNAVVHRVPPVVRERSAPLRNRPRVSFLL